MSLFYQDHTHRMLSYLPSHTTFIHLWFFSLVLRTGHTLSNLGTGTHLAMALNQIMQLVLHHQTIIHNPLISHTHTIPAIKLLITVIHIDTKVSSVFISPTVRANYLGSRASSSFPHPYSATSAGGSDKSYSCLR